MRTIGSYLEKWRNKQISATPLPKILTKNMREEREMMWWLEWEKIWISLMRLLKLLLPKFGCPNEVLEGESARKEKSNCGNQVTKIVGEEREKI